MSPEQIGRLIDEHSAALVLFARSRCDCPEDVVQEAFIELSRVDPSPNCPKAWLYRVVRNRAISAARSAKRRGKHEAAAAVEGQAWFAAGAENLLDAQTAAAALEELPLPQGETVVLRLWSQMTFEEIGKLTETSASTAQRRYAEALAALRNRLEPPCPKKPKPPLQPAR